MAAVLRSLMVKGDVFSNTLPCGEKCEYLLRFSSKRPALPVKPSAWQRQQHKLQAGLPNASASCQQSPCENKCIVTLKKPSVSRSVRLSCLGSLGPIYLSEMDGLGVGSEELSHSLAQVSSQATASLYDSMNNGVSEAATNSGADPTTFVIVAAFLFAAWFFGNFTFPDWVFKDTVFRKGSKREGTEGFDSDIDFQ